MEDSSTTADTLRLYRELREDGFDNVGVVLQAYLRRTVDDIAALADLRPNVRICKGIYVEPPSIAFTDYDAVRANYVRALDALLDVGAYVGIATHDEWLLGEALARVERGMAASEYEFQMLLGVREQRASSLVARRAPAARVRAVRRAVVPVLAAAPAGEPCDGRDDREGDRRPRARPRVIWAKAEGCRVTLDDGRELLDLTGGFGVAALGHRNARILEAWREQEVVHALGDLADAEVTVRFRAALPWPAKLGVTGEDAVEIALRTAHLATGGTGIVAFDGAYHGTGLLALAATGFEQLPRAVARSGSRAGAPPPVRRGPGRAARRHRCVIVEPVQGRAGSRVPPRRLPRDAAPPLRRGRRAPRRRRDLRGPRPRSASSGPAPRSPTSLCVGKALGGGLPLSAALFVTRRPRGALAAGPEDVYTHTHAGNPLACAAALVVLDEVPRCSTTSSTLGERFERAGWPGRGLLRARAGSADDALARGVLVVPAGLDGSLVQATPPLTITADEVEEALARARPSRARA